MLQDRNYFSLNQFSAFCAGAQKDIEKYTEKIWPEVCTSGFLML